MQIAAVQSRLQHAVGPQWAHHNASLLALRNAEAALAMNGIGVADILPPDLLAAVVAAAAEVEEAAAAAAPPAAMAVAVGAAADALERNNEGGHRRHMAQQQVQHAQMAERMRPPGLAAALNHRPHQRARAMTYEEMIIARRQRRGWFTMAAIAMAIACLLSDSSMQYGFVTLCWWVHDTLECISLLSWSAIKITVYYTFLVFWAVLQSLALVSWSVIKGIVYYTFSAFWAILQPLANVFFGG